MSNGLRTKTVVVLSFISATILFSLRSDYVNLSRSLYSSTSIRFDDDSDDSTYKYRAVRSSTAANDAIEYVHTTSSSNAAVNSFLVPEKADLEYTRNLRNIIHVNKTAGEVYPLKSCSPTVQVRVIQQNSQWMLQTIDASGRNKTKGGDEFYVTYTDNGSSNETALLASAVAFVDDQKNGAYSLRFSTTPMRPTLLVPSLVSNSMGTLKVDLQYTCGMGTMPVPLKDKWTTGGYCSTSWKRENVTAPPIKPFEPPTDIDFSTYDLVVSFGDSLMEGLVREEGGGVYFRNATSYKANIWQYLSLKTLPKVEFRLDQFHATELNASNVALVLGSSVWDILEIDNIEQGRDFADHLQACRQLVEIARKKYPRAQLFWKSPSALHIHRVSKSCFTRKSCNDRLRYMSNTRAMYLYKEQKKLMQEMGVPFIDLYDAYYLSADWTMWSDGRHFDSEFNRRVLSWFYNDDVDDDDDDESTKDVTSGGTTLTRIEMVAGKVASTGDLSATRNITGIMNVTNTVAVNRAVVKNKAINHHNRTKNDIVKGNNTHVAIEGVSGNRTTRIE